MRPHTSFEHEHALSHRLLSLLTNKRNRKHVLYHCFCDRGTPSWPRNARQYLSDDFRACCHLTCSLIRTINVCTWLIGDGKCSTGKFSVYPCIAVHSAFRSRPAVGLDLPPLRLHAPSPSCSTFFAPIDSPLVSLGDGFHVRTPFSSRASFLPCPLGGRYCVADVAAGAADSQDPWSPLPVMTPSRNPRWGIRPPLSSQLPYNPTREEKNDSLTPASTTPVLFGGPARVRRGCDGLARFL